MLKIAVCDDDKWMRQYLEKIIERETLVQADLYETGEELLESNTNYDILFLDIYLDKVTDSGKMNGMETARMLRNGSDVLIIFITAVREFVYEAYDVEAFHYLLKPVDEHKLCEVIQRAADRAKEKKNDISLLIKTGGKYLQIAADDIFYGENDGRKIILHTRNGNFSYYEKMEVLEQKLGGNFFRSHRGYLVHLKEVAGYDRTSITLKCGDTIFLAKQKYNDFVAAYMEYLKK